MSQTFLTHDFSTECLISIAYVDLFIPFPARTPLPFPVKVAPFQMFNSKHGPAFNYFRPDALLTPSYPHYVQFALSSSTIHTLPHTVRFLNSLLFSPYTFPYSPLGCATIRPTLCIHPATSRHTSNIYSSTQLRLHRTLTQAYWRYIDTFCHTEWCHTNTLARSSLTHIRVYCVQFSRFLPRPLAWLIAGGPTCLELVPNSL